MPWLIGVDEAGYGPNLGPLVMTLTALRVPSEGDDPWMLLSDVVRRDGDRADGRILIADSKRVYAPGKGLHGLESAVLASLAPMLPSIESEARWSLGQVLEHLCPFDWENLKDEPWFTGLTQLPIALEPIKVREQVERLSEACAGASVRLGLVCSQVVAAPRFNAIVDRWDSKAAVLSLGLAKLVRAAVEALPEEPLHFVLDKQGGRNQYAALLQNCFAEGFVVARAEGKDLSAYQVEGLTRPITITIVPRADQHHFAVALASMVCKYLREALMGEFNAFWRKHLPDLKPTAGYPEDAKRFLKDITATLERLGIAQATIWRSR